MSMERRVGLDASLPQGLPDLNHSGTGGARREASDADRQAFEHAFAQGDDGGEEKSLRAAEQAGTVSRPLDLFGGVPASAGPAAPDGAPQGLVQDLSEMAERLLVDDGSGRREVRIDLKDEVLPGVTVSVYEDEGRLVAAFVCASEPSREKLCACAQALACELAQLLVRPTLVRVTTDDPDDPCLFEASAAAP